MSAAFRAGRTVSAKGYGLGEKRLKYQPILSDFAIFNRESILLSVVPDERDIFFPIGTDQERKRRAQHLEGWRRYERKRFSQAYAA